jgi:CRP/FNR family cyclic AMP-dependent transcriptional regulator
LDTQIVEANGREYVRVLDADHALLASVPDESRQAAREGLLAVSVRVDRGRWESAELEDREALGLIVLDGLVTRNVDVAGTRSREVLGPGDIIRPWSDETVLDPLPSRTTWTVLQPARFALLDARFRLAMRRWPELGDEIVDRILHRTRWLAVLLAIANLRGVDERVYLLLWHLAGNWGKVTSAGTLVPFGLTHETIGDLVGARRPSVTTALTSLEREGKVERVKDGWLLPGDPPSTDQARPSPGPGSFSREPVG